MRQITHEEYLAELDYLIDNFGKDWEPVLREECLPLAQEDIEDHFNSAEGPFETWALHSAYTIQRYGPHALLILQQSLVAAAIGQGTGSVIIVDKEHIELGVDTSVIPYATTQQFGDDGRNIPARPFMWLSPEVIVEMNQHVAEYGKKILENGGRV